MAADPPQTETPSRAEPFDGRTRLRVHVTGIVQGVGFRPFVHRIAAELGLSGSVLNFAGGVDVEIEGRRADALRFVERLQAERPPIAQIDAVRVEELQPNGQTGFTIIPSQDRQDGPIHVSPDVAVCADCERELLDASDRRHRHPFCNCTNCGPRFTIVRSVPYDRPNTSMGGFPMCDACRREYEDISDRRYHAQPNACHECGPQVRYESSQMRASRDDALRAAAADLRKGRIVAVKGLGGFHLACDAANDDAVRAIRGRKRREQKPLAVMVADIDTARRLCVLDSTGEDLLRSPQRPIVLAPKRADASIAGSVAPDTSTLGVMLPYTPLHHLLLRDTGLAALVMTSGNLSDEPLATANEEARERLGHIVDGFLDHDREIVVPCDDSVVRPTRAGSILMRRARGYAPFPVRLGLDAPTILAVGGHLKNTFCLTVGGNAFLSQHIGDLDDAQSLAHFEWALGHLCRLMRTEPKALACDLHPDYLSTRVARQRASESGLPLFAVQHHHAHIASCMAENHFHDEVIGLACDGVGLGEDGAVWGFEVMVASLETYRRVAHLKPVPLPGGEAAIRQPWRMAGVYLRAAYGDGFLSEVDLPICECIRDEWPILAQMIEADLNCPMASSAGRLFDAASALLGLGDVSAYEGQAAMKLEAVAREHPDGYPWRWDDAEPGFILDPAPAIRGIVEDARAAVDPGMISGRFHRTVADMLLWSAERVADETGLRTVALSGGTFQNALLLETLAAALAERGFTVLTHRMVPPNDGGLSLGQAAVAAARWDGSCV